MDLTYLNSRWDDAHANSLDPVERLIYRSNLLGADWRITNTGGGNTSAKLTEKDPITGEDVLVMWVKGSGGDLRTAKKANFASLYQQRLLDLQKIYASMPNRGVKTPAEDTMVGMYAHCTFNLNPCAPSIDTPLHSFIPFAHVDHTHPAPIIALATAADGPALTKEIFGDKVIWTDWQRPGFELGLHMQQIVKDNPQAVGILMGGHGLINWANDDKECYLLSLQLIKQAAEYLVKHDKGAMAFGGQKYAPFDSKRSHEILVDVLPYIRGKVSQEKRFIGTVDHNDELMTYVNSKDAARLAELGTSCPDHFLRTKIKPLYVDWNPHTEDLAALKSKLDAGLESYQKDYAAYYEAHKHPNSPAMRVSYPSVVLIPGLGMIAWGKTKSESRVTAEFYNAAIWVMRGAESVSKYTAISRQEAFDIEYWLLEEAKLKRMPAEQEMARKIVVVIGAGSGIGRDTVDRLIKDGATFAAVDLNADAAKETADVVLKRIGMGIGVAGSGISGSGDCIGLGCDMTDRESIRKMLDKVVLAYGGIDGVAVTAGIFISPDVNGNFDDAGWAKSFAVNTTGPYLVAHEASRIWKEQKLSGSLVITTSVNAVVAKKGSFAYDVSKAATNHLIRELAIELAPHVRVNGVAPATVVEGSSMFPRDRVMASLAKYKIAYQDSEDTETLRSRLADFYASRTLTGAPIRPADQSEAIYLFLSERFSRTTGQIIQVDGGLVEAFLR
jgi:rhamnulose-1-phosphate aldolase/alcohol dehydrogenase